MALIGTENSIRCPHCGCVEFEERQVIRFSEALTMDKLKETVNMGAKAITRTRKSAYFCTKCQKQLI